MMTRALCFTLILAGLTGGGQARTAPSACRQIRQACREAGFGLAGRPDVSVCLAAVIRGAAPPTGPHLPTIDAKVVAACRRDLQRTPTTAPAISSPNKNETPSTRLPTAVSPHNPPPTQPGPD